MIALDTNVLIALWGPDTTLRHRAGAALQNATQRRPIYICGAVYAELMGLPARNLAKLDISLREAGISIDWDFNEQAWRTAGNAYQGYVIRRKGSGGGTSRRMLTGFLIGAHAAVRNAALLTLNESDFHAAYPQLQILSF